MKLCGNEEVYKKNNSQQRFVLLGFIETESDYWRVIK